MVAPPPHHEVRVGAYFYPQTSFCPDRLHRGLGVFKELGMAGFLEQSSELELARTAPALFDGHDQPRTYCLPGKLPETDWDDYHTDTLQRQCLIARRYGLSYFIVDAYDGVRGGETWSEFSEPLMQLDKVARHTPTFRLMDDFKYAVMQTLESARVVLPIPARGRREYGNVYTEPDRYFDVSPDTARAMVRSGLQHWDNGAYLMVQGDRPYISVLMPPFAPDETDAAIQAKLNDFVDALKTEAIRHNWEPYVVGVMRTTGEVQYKRWVEAGVDATTEYCDLVRHGWDAEPIQQYGDLVAARRLGWDALRGAVPYMSSPAVGWDASPRGERGVTWDEVKGIHPYTPIVVGGTPDLFGQAVADAIAYAKTAAPADEQLITIFAWNEVTEGGVLIPRLLPDGTIDDSLLRAVQAAVIASRQ